MSTFYSSYSGVNGGGGGSGVSSLNTLSGALTLVAGSGITITPSGGNTLTIAATGGGGVPSVVGKSGQFLSNDGTTPLWDSDLAVVAGTTLVVGYDLSLNGGSLDMQGSIIHNVNKLTDPQDDLSIDVDNRQLVFSGSTIMFDWSTAGILDASTNLIKNVVDPVDPQDAATKAYVDSTGLTNPLANNTFLQGRNAADDASFNLIGVDAADFLQIGGAVGGAGQPVQIRLGDTASQQGLKLNGVAAILIASQTADSGDILLQGQTVQILPAPSSAASSTLQFHDAAATNYTGFKAPDTLSATNTYTLPDGDGSANNVLSTDGAGNLSWTSGGGGATTALDNLASVAINTDLIFDGSFNAQVRTPDNGSGATKFLRLATGNAISGVSGEITIRPGDSDTAPGQLTLEGALASDADVAGGEILVHTLPTTGTGNSGQLRFISGNSVDGNSGDLSLIAGTPSGAGVSGRVFLSAALQLPATNTTAGTTGNQTINKPSGTVNFATAASSLTVTNSLVTANSIVFAVVRTNDAAAVIKNVVPTLGSFTITLNAAAGAETSVGFMVINQ